MAEKQEQSAGGEPPPGVESGIRMRVFGRTDVGQVREHNEDNFLVADLTRDRRGLMDSDRVQSIGRRGTILGVCDGMGGAAAGEVASQLAVDIIYSKLSQGDPPRDHDELAMRLVQAIEAAGLRIFSEAKLDRSRRGMGTTATVCALMDDHLFIGQVGDSRAYVLRADRLVQVTRDQSLVNQLIEAGQLTEEEAESFEHNNIILQALGTTDSVQVDLTYVHLRRGDTLLLCSDGLSGMIRNEEIREILRTVDEPIEACKVLTDRANQAGGQDNITVIVAKFDGESLRPLGEDDELRYRKYQLPEPAAATPDRSPEPSRKVKEVDAPKISSGRSSKLQNTLVLPAVQAPPPPAPASPSDPVIETRYEDADSEPPAPGRRADDLEGEEDAPHSFREAARRASDESIDLPTEGAPSWLVTMMIVSAVTCVAVAGYYLLR